MTLFLLSLVVACDGPVSIPDGSDTGPAGTDPPFLTDPPPPAGDLDGVPDALLALEVATEPSASSQVQVLDLLGEPLDTWDLSDGPGARLASPTLQPRLDGEGWWALREGRLLLLAPGGAVTVAWDLDEDPALTADDKPGLLGGLAAHPEGDVILAGGDRLLRVTPEASATVIARWDPAAPGTEISGSLVTVSPITGQISLFGYFGGFATWSSEAGLVVHRPEVLPEVGASFLDAHADAHGTAYALGQVVVEGEGVHGIWRFDGAGYSLVAPWTHANGDPLEQEPASFAIGDGAFYVTANGEGRRTVWHLPEGDPHGTLLHEAEGDGRAYRGLALQWAAEE